MGMSLVYGDSKQLDIKLYEDYSKVKIRKFVSSLKKSNSLTYRIQNLCTE